MNQNSSTRTSLRAVLGECLCDRGVEVTVVSFAAVHIGLYIVRAGRQVHEDLLTMIGLMLLALPLVLAWIRHDPEEPEGDDRPPPCTGAPGEIRRMTDAQFDRLLDEVEQQMPVSRHRPYRRQRARGHEFAAIRAATGLRCGSLFTLKSS